MTERRYTETEVEEIFARAVEAQRDAARQLPATEGLTLSEVQEIGQQVGITPDVVADSARTLDRHEPRFRRRLLGLTIGVGRTVSLDRKVTTEEWERMVVVIRDTFDARGNAFSDGNLRQWTNGNLQVLIEPTEQGDRMRMRTINASARGLLTIGASVLGALGVLALVTIATGDRAAVARLSVFIPTASVAAAGFGLGLARLRGWAATRMRQMDDLAARFRK